MLMFFGYKNKTKPSQIKDLSVMVEKKSLNQQFQDFLNKQGEFTSEKMSLIMMETMSILDKSEVGLGIVYSDGISPDIQGYFFDYLEKDGRFFLFMGFDGKDGNRFITPLEIPIYYYGSLKPARFQIEKYNKNTVMLRSGVDVEAEDYSDDKGKLVSLLNDLKGRTLLLRLITYKFSESDFYRFDLDKETAEIVNNFIKEVDSKSELTVGLFQLLTQNGMSPYTNPDKIKGNSEPILKITNSEEMGKINIDQVPIIDNIGYFSGE